VTLNLEEFGYRILFLVAFKLPWLWLTENMPMEELLKRYAGYSSDGGRVSDVDTSSTAKKNLRSSSAHKGICNKFTFLFAVRFTKRAAGN